MGEKSRGGWSIKACIKECENRGVLCEECFNYSKLVGNRYPTEEIKGNLGKYKK